MEYAAQGTKINNSKLGGSTNDHQNECPEDSKSIPCHGIMLFCLPFMDNDDCISFDYQSFPPGLGLF